MAPSLPLLGAVPPRKKLAKAELRGEGQSKFLGDVALGPVIERAIAISGLTKDQAALEMGYGDASSVSKWIANIEPPNLARIWSVRQLRAGLLMSLAEQAGECVEVETAVRLRVRPA